MKAGDFFGEIGILNLDDLNKSSAHANEEISGCYIMPNLYDLLKDFYFNMPGVWTAKKIEIFVESCRFLHKELERTIDDITGWRKIALLGAKIADDENLFNVNNCIELAQSLRSYAESNLVGLGHDSNFLQYLLDIQDLVDYFPKVENLDEMHPSSQQRARRFEDSLLKYINSKSSFLDESSVRKPSQIATNTIKNHDSLLSDLSSKNELITETARSHDSWLSEFKVKREKVIKKTKRNENSHHQKDKSLYNKIDQLISRHRSLLGLTPLTNSPVTGKLNGENMDTPLSKSSVEEDKMKDSSCEMYQSSHKNIHEDNKRFRKNDDRPSVNTLDNQTSSSVLLGENKLEVSSSMPNQVTSLKTISEDKNKMLEKSSSILLRLQDVIDDNAAIGDYRLNSACSKTIESNLDGNGIPLVETPNIIKETYDLVSSQKEDHEMRLFEKRGRPLKQKSPINNDDGNSSFSLSLNRVNEEEISSVISHHALPTEDIPSGPLGPYQKYINEPSISTHEGTDISVSSDISDQPIFSEDISVVENRRLRSGKARSPLNYANNQEPFPKKDCKDKDSLDVTSQLHYAEKIPVDDSRLTEGIEIGRPSTKSMENQKPLHISQVKGMKKEFSSDNTKQPDYAEEGPSDKRSGLRGSTNLNDQGPSIEEPRELRKRKLNSEVGSTEFVIKTEQHGDKTEYFINYKNKLININPSVKLLDCVLHPVELGPYSKVKNSNKKVKLDRDDVLNFTVPFKTLEKVPTTLDNEKKIYTDNRKIIATSKVRRLRNYGKRERSVTTKVRQQTPRTRINRKKKSFTLSSDKVSQTDSSITMSAEGRIINDISPMRKVDSNKTFTSLPRRKGEFLSGLSYQPCSKENILSDRMVRVRKNDPTDENEMLQKCKKSRNAENNKKSTHSSHVNDNENVSTDAINLQQCEEVFLQERRLRERKPRPLIKNEDKLGPSTSDKKIKEPMLNFSNIPYSKKINSIDGSEGFSSQKSRHIMNKEDEESPTTTMYVKANADEASLDEPYHQPCEEIISVAGKRRLRKRKARPPIKKENNPIQKLERTLSEKKNRELTNDVPNLPESVDKSPTHRNECLKTQSSIQSKEEEENPKSFHLHSQTCLPACGIGLRRNHQSSTTVDEQELPFTSYKRVDNEKNSEYIPEDIRFEAARRASLAINIVKKGRKKSASQISYQFHSQHTNDIFMTRESLSPTTEVCREPSTSKCEGFKDNASDIPQLLPRCVSTRDSYESFNRKSTKGMKRKKDSTKSSRKTDNNTGSSLFQKHNPADCKKKQTDESRLSSCDRKQRRPLSPYERELAIKHFTDSRVPGSIPQSIDDPEIIGAMPNHNPPENNEGNQPNRQAQGVNPPQDEIEEEVNSSHEQYLLFRNQILAEFERGYNYAYNYNNPDWFLEYMEHFGSWQRSKIRAFVSFSMEEIQRGRRRRSAMKNFLKNMCERYNINL